MLLLGGRQSHRRDQWPDGLRLTRQRHPAKRRNDLAKTEIDDQQSPSRRAPHSRDQRARPLLQPVTFQQPDHRQHDPDDRDVAVLVESVAERAEHFQERHMAEQAGDDRRHRDDEQRIEAQRKADDDKRNPQQWPVIDHSPFLPKPPPPGVSITNRSPGCISAEAVALSISTLPSVRSTQLRPACASAPPSMPLGGTRRRLARMLARIGSRRVTARTTPSPPRCAPSPPEPRRIANWSSLIGSRVSSISGSVRRLLVMCVWPALVPSWSGPAPDPPAIVS